MNALHQPSFKCPAAPAVADIATAVMNGVQCLDTSGLAALLGCAPHHVRHQLGHRLDFPAPFIDLSPRLRYWRVIDVLQWLYQPGMRALSVADLGAPRLDVAGIADLLGCSRQHATAVIAKRKDFPPPCINVSNRMRTWLYRDVLAWLAPRGGRVWQRRPRCSPSDCGCRWSGANAGLHPRAFHRSSAQAGRFSAAFFVCQPPPALVACE